MPIDLSHIPPPTTATGPGAVAPPPPGARPPGHAEGSGGAANGARRTAAGIIGATGAILLVVAAALFLAVRWSAMSNGAKGSVLVAATVGCLVGGYRLRRRLPVTGAVVFHLGAFLLPVDLVALDRVVGFSPEWLIALEGALVALAFPLLDRLVPSRLLRVAAVAGAIVLATGLGLLTPVPAPAWAAAIGVAVLAVRPASIAMGLTAAAGPLAAVVVFAAVPSDISATWLGGPTGWQLVAGLAAAGLLALHAQRSGNDSLAPAAIAAVAVAVLRAWVGPQGIEPAFVTGVPVLILLAEAAAMGLRRDDLWGPVTDATASIGELIALGYVVWGGVLLALVRTPAPPTGRDITASFVIMTLAALVAVARRGGRWPLGEAALAVFVPAAVAVQTTEPLLVASVAAALAVVGLLHRRGEVPPLTLAAGALAPWVGYPAISGAWAPALVAVGTLALAARRPVAGVEPREAEPVRPRQMDLLPPPVGPALPGPHPHMVRAAVRRRPPLDRGILPAGLAALGTFAAAVSAPLDAAPALSAFAVTCWLLGIVIGRPVVSDVPRLAAAGSVLVLLAWQPQHQLAPALLLLVLTVIEVARTERPALAFGAIAPAHLGLYALVRLTGAGFETAGLALVVAALVYGGFSLLVAAGYERVLHAAAMSGGLIGLLLAARDAETFGTALIMVGVGLIAAATVGGPGLAGYGGSLLATLGIWVHLGLRDVSASEAYTLPLAVFLLIIGWLARQRNARSSWVAYVPAILLVALPALAQRVADGSAWHSVVVGAIALVAVAAGGWQRLGGPLVTGIGLLLAVTAYESLAVVAQVPTWAWLGTGGLVLLTTALVLERTDTSPVEVSRRVVETLADRFD